MEFSNFSRVQVFCSVFWEWVIALEGRGSWWTISCSLVQYKPRTIRWGYIAVHQQKMLLNLHKRVWTSGLCLKEFTTHAIENEEATKQMLTLAESYNKSIQEEQSMTPEQLAIRHVGKKDPKRHLQDTVEKTMSNNVVQTMGTMIDSIVF